MTELKTLDDISIYEIIERKKKIILADNFKILLKAEAIKHWKYIYSVRGLGEFSEEEQLGIRFCFSSLSEWIKHFFNLTSEDIK